MLYLPIDMSIMDVLKEGNEELATLVNMALADMNIDIRSPYKNPNDPRKVTIDLTLVKFNDEKIAVDFKVTPKAATYTKVPETIDKVAAGQISIYDELISEVAEDDDEMELMSADMEEDRKRYELLAGVEKKRKRA